MKSTGGGKDSDHEVAEHAELVLPEMPPLSSGQTSRLLQTSQFC
jgi:hypothetical protein